MLSHAKTSSAFLLLIFVFTCAIPATAQEPVFEPDEIAAVTIEVWPDYDRPETLVLMSAALPADTPTPVRLRLPVPAGATLNAVAFSDAQGQLLNLSDYELQSGLLVLTSPTPGVRVEYYVPHQAAGDRRTVDFSWTAPVAVGRLDLTIQEPAFGQNFTLDQSIEELVVTNDGLRYHRLPAAALAAGETVSLSATYDLPGGRLTASQPEVVDLPAAPAAPAAAPSAASSWLANLQANWPWTTAGVALLAIALFSGWQVWRERRPARSRRTRATKPARKREVFCTQCGTPNQAGDNFCRKCGQKLKT